LVGLRADCRRSPAAWPLMLAPPHGAVLPCA
jgi:hypothetical protein